MSRIALAFALTFTAVAVTAVRLPERRNHEAQQQLDLKSSDERGGTSEPPLVRPIRWLP